MGIDMESPQQRKSGQVASDRQMMRSAPLSWPGAENKWSPTAATSALDYACWPAVAMQSE